MDYATIVFDTAPTGHTLRLLQFPATLEKGLSKLMSLKSRFGGLMNQMSRMFGMEDEFGEDALLGRLEGLKDVIEQVNRQFKDPVTLVPLLPFFFPVFITVSSFCSRFWFCITAQFLLRHLTFHICVASLYEFCLTLCIGEDSDWCNLIKMRRI